jgi:hypothetical protein
MTAASERNAPANFSSVKRATLNALRQAPGKDQIQASYRRLGRKLSRQNPRKPMNVIHWIPLAFRRISQLFAGRLSPCS